MANDNVIFELKCFANIFGMFKIVIILSFYWSLIILHLILILILTWNGIKYEMILFDRQLSKTAIAPYHFLHTIRLTLTFN